MPAIVTSCLLARYSRSYVSGGQRSATSTSAMPRCTCNAPSTFTNMRKTFDSKRVHTAGTGTRPNTRMQTLLNSHAGQRDRDVERYRASRKALIILDPTGDWQKNLRPLLQQDIHAPIRGQATHVKMSKKRKAGKGNLESEGRRTLSWIWRAIPQSTGESDEAISQELEEGSYLLIFHFQAC